MALFAKQSLREKKQQNLERARQSWQSGETRVAHFPPVIYLEPTSICNLSCPMCPVAMGVSEYNYPEKLLDMELVEKLREPLAHARRVFLSGGGEPLLHKRFLEMVSFLKKLELEIIFNTNGTLIDAAIAREFVDLAVDCISISVDAIDPSLYRKLRAGAEFEQVLRGVTILNEEKRKRGAERPLLNMQFTLMRENEKELSGIIGFAEKYHINHLVVEPLSPVFSFDSKYQAFFQDHYLPPHPRLVQTLKELRTKAQSKGFHFSSHYLEEKRLPKRCSQPWLNFGVRTNGRIFLCCGTAENMGLLSENSFDEIWNGEVYRFFRQELAAGKPPEPCALCLQESRSPWFNHELLEK
jgi:MoaA/NifB/PqqE/SkfB family radical SAM enzyme